MRKLPLLAIPLLLLAGCTSEDLPQQPGAGEYRTPLTVESVTIDSQVRTRADAGYDDLADGKSIGLFLEGTAAGTYTALNNRTYKRSGTKIAPTAAAQTIYLGAYDAYVCAYYLPALNISNKTAYTLTTANYTDAADLVYAKNQTVNGTTAGCKVNFKMVHAYAQIELAFKRENYPNTCKITTVTLKNNSLAKTASLNLATGVLGTPSVTASQSFYTNTAATGTGITIAATGDTHKVNLLMVPCALANVSGTGLSMTFNVDGKDMTMNIPYATLGSLVAGNKYQITANLKGTEITVSSVQVAQWTAKSIGEYTPEP